MACIIGLLHMSIGRALQGFINFLGKNVHTFLLNLNRREEYSLSNLNVVTLYLTGKIMQHCF